MDELWQRYRAFWTPVLIGMGVFLVGVIAVFIVNDDPEETRFRVESESRKVSRMVQPTSGQINAQRRDATTRSEKVAGLAERMDQAGVGKDVTTAAVSQALTAAILRGGGPDAFEDEPGLEEAARGRYDRAVQDRIDLLRTGDPNVGFSRLLNDVWSELRVRANRADVDLDADQLGFASVSSVNRATLPQRILNLALAARVVDAAIRSGVRSVDEIRFESRSNGGPDSFLLEWPVTFVITGKMDALRPVLQHLTGASPTSSPQTSSSQTSSSQTFSKAVVPILGATFSPPRRAAGTEGLVELTVTASSLRAQPKATLDLASEEEPR